MRIGIPGIALALTALFVFATWRTGDGLPAAARRRGPSSPAPASRSGWRRGRRRAVGLAGPLRSAPAADGDLVRVDDRDDAGPRLVGFGRRFADKLPLVALIGFQAFRLPLELVMHRAAAAGIMPNVMMFTGYNFDIVTGATALPLALLPGAPRFPAG